MKTIDARGLSCPEPVLRARTAIQSLPNGAELEVLVETVTSRENVRRMVQSLGCSSELSDQPDGYRILVRKP